MKFWSALVVALFPWQCFLTLLSSQQHLILKVILEVKGQQGHQTCTGSLLMVSGWHGNDLHTYTSSHTQVGVLYVQSSLTAFTGYLIAMTTEMPHPLTL